MCERLLISWRGPFRGVLKDCHSTRKMTFSENKLPLQKAGTNIQRQRTADTHPSLDSTSAAVGWAVGAETGCILAHIAPPEVSADHQHRTDTILSLTDIQVPNGAVFKKDIIHTHLTLVRVSRP